MTSSLNLSSLNFPYQECSWEANLVTLLKEIAKLAKESFILAPELCLTGYAYDKMELAAQFGQMALGELMEATREKTFGFTCIAQTDEGFVNRFYLLDDGKIVHTQDKAKLFPLGDEPSYFVAGCASEITPFVWRGLKIGVLICFEIRFVELWLKLRGSDLILVPALWGEARKGHFETLCDALAIANQCYVLSSNSTDSNMAGSGGIIDPFGIPLRDDKQKSLTCKVDLKRIKTMRRYIQGIVE